jgi:hypothetical protein
MQKSRFSTALGWFTTALIAALISVTASAQEIPTKQQAASLQVFGLFSYVQPHYYPSNNNGISLGADLNFRPLSVIQPSLELRATLAPGSDVTEHTYNFGPRIELNLSRIRPYAFAFIGKGYITFAHPVIYPTGPYSHDDSTVYSGGGGVDYLLTPRIGLRADIMLQRWNLGGGATTTVFHPRLYSVGADYRFDFNRPHFHRHR